MQKIDYLLLPALINLIDEPYKSACKKIYEENLELFKQTPGALKNHQSYPGGYIHHIEEVMNLARVLFYSLAKHRELPFSLSDGLLILFLHDLEKPWKYIKGKNDELEIKRELWGKTDQLKFQLRKAEEYGIQLTEEHKNALEFMAGENEQHSYYERKRGPLAAFCGACDSFSARVWFDYPRKEGEDSWKG